MKRNVAAEVTANVAAEVIAAVKVKKLKTKIKKLRKQIKQIKKQIEAQTKQNIKPEIFLQSFRKHEPENPTPQNTPPLRMQKSAVTPTPNEKKRPKEIPRLPAVKIDLNKLDPSVKKRFPKFNSEKELQNFILTAIENEMNIEISPYLTIEELKALEKKANQ